MGRRDQRAANSDYYRRNRERELERVRLRQDATRDGLRRLRMRPCLDWGGVFLAHQMDLDHRDPTVKLFRLTSGRAMLASWASLWAEITKCDVVCANCHRIRTVERAAKVARPSVPDHPSAELERKRAYWRMQARLLDALKVRTCADCGREYPACAMDFDHRDPIGKSQAVSRMIGRAGIAKIMAEAAKCDIVCANCHRDRTYRRRGAGSSERE